MLLLFFALGLSAFFASKQCNALSAEEWKAYKQAYGKVYSGEEDKYRMGIWLKRKEEFDAHNKAGTSSFTMSENYFTDLTRKERVQEGCREPPADFLKDLKMRKSDRRVNSRVIPTSKNWTAEGAVTGVEDQGKCNACYAFATKGVAETQYYLRHGRLPYLSAQQIVDCTYPHNDGCETGTTDFSFVYIFQSGLAASVTYPYVAKLQNCTYNPGMMYANVTHYEPLDQNENALHEAVGLRGTVAANVYWADDMFDYTSGVYDKSSCNNVSLPQHSVLVVGYGVTSVLRTPFWIIKNSYGPKFGEKGYMRILRNKNWCGIAKTTYICEVA